MLPSILRNRFAGHPKLPKQEAPDHVWAPDHTAAQPLMNAMREADRRYAAMVSSTYKRATPKEAFVTMSDHQIAGLADDLNIDVGAVRAFQDFLHDGNRNCNLDGVFCFVDAWKRNPPFPNTIPFQAEIEKRVDALADVRITFRNTSEQHGKPVGKFDIGSQVSGAVLNAGPRKLSGGKRGAAAAVERGYGQELKSQLVAYRKKHGDAVGNVKTGDAFLAEIKGVGPDGKQKPLVVVTAAGPDVAHSARFGFKIPRIGNKGPTEKQERQLRAAYRTYFKGVDRYNLVARRNGELPIEDLRMVTLSAGVFQYPEQEAAQILLEETMRYLAQRPGMRATFLNVHSDTLRDAINTRLQAALPPAHYHYLDPERVAESGEQSDSIEMGEMGSLVDLEESAGFDESDEDPLPPNYIPSPPPAADV